MHMPTPPFGHRHTTWCLASVANALRAAHAKYHGLVRPASLLLPTEQLTLPPTSIAAALQAAKQLRMQGQHSSAKAQPAGHMQAQGAQQGQQAQQAQVLGQLAMAHVVLSAVLDAGTVLTSAGMGSQHCHSLCCQRGSTAALWVGNQCQLKLKSLHIVMHNRLTHNCDAQLQAGSVMMRPTWRSLMGC